MLTQSRPVEQEPVDGFRILWPGRKGLEEYIITEREDGHLKVTGPRGEYVVRDKGTSCECPGWVYGATRGELARCRHIRMAQLVLDYLRKHGCPDCLTLATRLGKGRAFGQHPEHVHCAKCGRNLTWTKRTA